MRMFLSSLDGTESVYTEFEDKLVIIYFIFLLSEYWHFTGSRKKESIIVENKITKMADVSIRLWQKHARYLQFQGRSQGNFRENSYIDQGYSIRIDTVADADIKSVLYILRDALFLDNAVAVIFAYNFREASLKFLRKCITFRSRRISREALGHENTPSLFHPDLWLLTFGWIVVMMKEWCMSKMMT